MAQMRNGDYEKVPVVELGENDFKLKEEPTYGYGVRHIQALLFFSSLLIAYLARAHLGVSIVAMTYYMPINNETNVNAANSSFYSDNPNNTNYVDSNNTDEMVNLRTLLEEMENVTSDDNGIYKKHVWSKPVQEMVLISFFIGYCATQYAMSMVAQRWGGKLPLQIALFVNSFVSIATPWIAFWGGWKAVCICRILQGVSQAGVFPSIQTLLAHWVPPKEFGRLTSFVYIGSVLGTVVAFQLGGVLAASPWGWPSIFWGTGVTCFVAFLALTAFGAATPHEHKSITEEERIYITHTMSNFGKKKPSVPIKAALSCKHTWAVISTHVGSSVAYLFVFMQVPTYIHYSLGVNVKDSGLYSSLPYVAGFFAAVFYGIFSDFLTNRKIVSIATARKIFNTIAQIGTAACLVAVSYTKDVSLAIILLVLSQISHVGIHVGWMVNYIDLTSNFSGAILAVGNTLMNMVSLTLPILVSNIVIDVTNQSQWRVMFYLMAGFAVITNAVFVAFMSADRQPWDDPRHTNKDCEDIALEKNKKISS